MSVTHALQDLAQGAAYVVAADSGLRHAAALGVRPAAIVGDFDSVAADVLEAYQDVNQVRHPPEKDWLDLELALHHLQDQGLDDIVIVAGFGSRLDQSLAALLIAARAVQQGTQVQFHSGRQQAFVLASGQQRTLPLEPGQTFSLLSLLTTARVSVTGAKYTLQEAVLEFGVGLGVSNVAEQHTTVTVHQGLVAVIVEDSASL